ncbi:ribonuclease H2 subunit C family protein KNAG_0C00800 [Huiozyma naganishii CBS 8797]|uniref:Uncharacterized protein n=1 Tax=Huiozyma naganishii (strain ATCC MYA-139 / BCRC 22969 / CBS 8797 / KCTC 17520 / NBRC 10181 / NCYC 3082 / Yp74L-3) TaxID=1071383 RepID=J7S4A9_HUIN7|nr:hypothetical protein KNAG_0C00800 [Kazachstania naganishii CBS 8797]CCK69194.1 hypothetical protein KNAG_0C00800 [Kazachstania naganishii CBS 8797]
MTIQDNVVPNNYTVHMVPCKIRYTGPTKELTNNMIIEETNDKYNSTYITGHKIRGREVDTSQQMLSPYILKDNPETTTDEKLSTISSKNASPIQHLINYEREGNESRLVEEMSKLEEFLLLNTSSIPKHLGKRQLTNYNTPTLLLKLLFQQTTHPTPNKPALPRRPPQYYLDTLFTPNIYTYTQSYTSTQHTQLNSLTTLSAAHCIATSWKFLKKN